MRYLGIITLILIACTGTFAQAQDPQIEARLELHSDHTLPGIPVGLTVFVINKGSTPFIVPSTAKLLVTTDKGVTFEALTGDRDLLTFVRLPYEDEASLIIRPNSSLDIVFPIHVSLAQPEWFFDERLSWPGVYRLQIRFENSANHTGEAITSSVLSNMVTLVVQELHGEDLLVWNRMLEISGNEGWNASRWLSRGFALAKEIWERHRTSNYAPFIALILPIPIEDQISHVELALSLFPNHMMTPYFHKSIAIQSENKMFHELNIRKNAVSAERLFEKKQKHLQQILLKSKDPKLRKEAEEQLKFNWQGILRASQALNKDRETQ